MKTQIVLPDALAEDLKTLIPNRKRSQFISEAVEKQLRALKFQKTLKKVAGIWKNRPEFRTQADINRYLGRFRARFRRRG